MPISVNALCFVGMGGALGAIARFIISSHFINDGNQFPWGSFIANIIGAFMVACLYVMLIEKPAFNLQFSEPLKQLLMIGFLGALTTFSSFSLESIHLISNNHYQLAISYILLTLMCCLGATYITLKLSRLLLH